VMRCHWGKRYSGSIDPLAQEGGSFKGVLQWERPVGQDGGHVLCYSCKWLGAVRARGYRHLQVAGL